MRQTVKHLFTLLMVFGVLTFSSCYTMEHTVGEGAQSNKVETAKQWYVLWGLVPLNEVDSKAMADGDTNYTVVTEMSFIDGLISSVLGGLTIGTRTVEVTH